MADEILISGFVNDNINGAYPYWTLFNGLKAYRKDVDHIIVWHERYFNYGNCPAYYLLEERSIAGGIPLWVPVARIEGDNPIGDWETLMDITSGEQTIGIIDEESSSSSFDGSLDSSEEYSSSSSLGNSSSSSESSESSSSSLGNSSSSSESSESSSSSLGNSNDSSSSSSGSGEGVVAKVGTAIIDLGIMG